MEELPGTTAGKRGLVRARRREATNNSNSTTSNSITRCILVGFDELRAVVSERESSRQPALSAGQRVCRPIQF